MDDKENATVRYSELRNHEFLCQVNVSRSDCREQLLMGSLEAKFGVSNQIRAGNLQQEIAGCGPEYSFRKHSQKFPWDGRLSIQFFKHKCYLSSLEEGERVKQT